MRTLSLFLFVSALMAQMFPIDSTWSAYSFNWSKGTFDPYPTTYPPNAAAFVFPSTAPLRVVAMDKRGASGISGTTLTATFMIQPVTPGGVPQFIAPDDPGGGCQSTTPPNLRFFITTNNLGAKRLKLTETGRWWSRYASFPLALTSGATIGATLDPSQWSDALGHLGSLNAAHTTAFWNVVNGAKEIGLNFGGICYYNHGVYNAGDPTVFTIWNFQGN